MLKNGTYMPVNCNPAMKEIISVILPTYNEKGNIIRLIDEIIKAVRLVKKDYEIIVVDDDSPDNTGNYARENYQNDANVKVIIRKNQRGLASAIRAGIDMSKGEVIIVMDTDFNHDPKLIPQFVEFLGHYDFIIGSRFTMGGGMYSRFRYYCSFVYNFMIRIILHTQIQDNLSGFFSVKRGRLLKLDFDKIFWGYGDYFFRLLFYAKKLNFKILAVPVIYGKRDYGQSKTSFIAMLFKYSKELITLRLRHLGKEKND